jgi:hypothetical protein
MQDGHDATTSSGSKKPAKTKSAATGQSTRPKRYRKVDDFQLLGGTALSGLAYVRVKASRKAKWVPWRDFAWGTVAREKLADAGIIFFPHMWEHLKRDVKSVWDFPPRPLLENPGRNGSYFAMPDGQVFSPAGMKPGIVLFDTVESRCSQLGSLEEWLDGLDPIVAGQDLPSFALCVPFVGPILSQAGGYGNPGFAWAGRKGIGKTTLLFLAASVLGPATDPKGRDFWISANATANALEQIMPEHADLVMLIDELNLYAAGEPPKVRAAKVNELVFRFDQGATKGRHGDAKQRKYRFAYMTTTNEVLADVLGNDRPDVADAASDRLLTLKISADRPYGIFDELAPGFASGDAMAKHLTNVISRNHGHAMPRFLQGLVDALAEDEAGLRKEIQDHLRTFRKQAGVDPNVGSEVRVADRFGLVYAAGRLAQKWGALPKSIKCGPAVRACYRLNRAANGPKLSMLERLYALRDRPEVIRINGKNVPVIDDDTLDAAPAVVKMSKGIEELILTKKQLVRAFGNPRMVVNDLEVAPFHQRDPDQHDQVKKLLRQGKKPERVYCFHLPD